MRSKEDLKNFFIQRSKLKKLHSQFFEQLEITDCTKSQNNAVIHFRSPVNASWVDCSGKLTLSILTSVFDLASFGVLLYINKSNSLTIDIHTSLIRQTGAGENLNFYLKAFNFSQKLFIITLDVLDSDNNLVAVGRHRLKAMKTTPSI